MCDRAAGDLSGITIGITAERRAEDFIAALQRHGATVVHAPAIRIVPLPHDTLLRAATADILAEPVGFTAITTGAGFRGWLEAARGWGLSEQLLSVLRDSRVFARGPKASGALRAAGLREEWSAPGESNVELFAHLLESAISGARVAVQLHGTQLPEHTDALCAAGATVVELQPYRWLAPAEPALVHRLVDAAIARKVDAVAFTSAPAAANFLSFARETGRYDELVAALKRDVVCACVGPVTAGPLTELGVPTLQPERQRLGALVKLLVSELG
jgi:uroporphyrinogen-III synthase